MFAGPIIAREIRTAPRPVWFYVLRAAFATGMFIVMWTAWQAWVGWREVAEVGTLARFGGIVYLLFAVIQLTLLLFFAPLSAATAVAHEKDRRTFVLLLMTDLSDLEIVLGKLLASLVRILTILAAGVPVLAVCALLGGISFAQVANLFAVTAASGLAGGAIGLLIALWRDRTSQSLSLTIQFVVLSIVGAEVVARALPDIALFGVPLVEVLNPYRAMLTVLYPPSDQLVGVRASSVVYIACRLISAAALIAFGTWKLRTWNPGRGEPRERREGEELRVVEAAPATAAAGRTATGLHVPRRTHRKVAGAARPYRVPWSDQPVLWREVRTRAYGSRPMAIKAVYLFLCALMIALAHVYCTAEGRPGRASWVILPVAILSLLMANAQAVSALTSERDSGALDLLLVSELSPSQFIYGKLFGSLYNVKEMIALPIGLMVYYAYRRGITTSEAVYMVLDFLLLCHFVTMLGLHAALTYTSSRTAVSHSLGASFFLMAGILICAFLIMLSNRDFGRQLLSFMVFIGVGSVALFGSLGARNPSHAILLVSLLTPFWSFFCVISLLRGDVLAAFLFSVGIYGFALAAMLVPAVSGFDIALGRTGAIQG